MIAQKYRFHGHGSLKYVYKNGTSVRSSHFSIKYINNPRRSVSRCSVVVSKKVHKSAVGRNRIRRRVYEIMRPALEEITIPSDIVIIVWSAEVRTLPFIDISSQIQKLLTKATLLPSRNQ